MLFPDPAEAPVIEELPMVQPNVVPGVVLLMLKMACCPEQMVCFEGLTCAFGNGLTNTTLVVTVP